MNQTSQHQQDSTNPFDAPRPAMARRTPAWVVGLIAAVGFAAGIFVGPLLFKPHQHETPAATTSTATGKQLWTCGMHPQVIQDHPGDCPICHMELTPLKTDAATTMPSGGSGPAVTIDPVIVQNIGIRTAAVQRTPITRHIRVVGYLEEPEPLHRDINLRVSGWIEKLYANIDGMPIQEGQTLFDLYSPDLRGAIEELIAARKALARGTGGEESLRLLQEGVATKLRLMGLTAEQVEQYGKAEEAPGTVPILAPMSGHLTEKMVYEGAAVKAGDLVMRLASRDRMWLDAQVYETQLPLIKLGDKAVATVVSQPGRKFEGRVVFFHPHLDEMTRTAKVRVEIPNEDLMLRQGMYATLEIESQSAEPALAVPHEAIIDTGKRQIAFVSLGDGRFEPRDLKLGISGDGLVQVLSGLNEGEQIVTSAQFLLDSESRLKEAIQKHLEHGMVAQARPKPQDAPPAATGPKPVFDVPHLADIINAYLALAKPLGERQTADTPFDPAELLRFARLAAEHGDADARALVQPIIAAAEATAGKTLSEQRKLFKPLSTAVIDLVDRSKPAQALFVAHCPMAIDDAGADWLQTDEDIANPYFATQMKSCGEIRRKIEPSH